MSSSTSFTPYQISQDHLKDAAALRRKIDYLEQRVRLLEGTLLFFFESNEVAYDQGSQFKDKLGSLLRDIYDSEHPTEKKKK